MASTKMKTENDRPTSKNAASTAKPHALTANAADDEERVVEYETTTCNNEGPMPLVNSKSIASAMLLLTQRDLGLDLDLMTSSPLARLDSLLFALPEIQLPVHTIPLTSFDQFFNRLPLEIRTMIWKFAARNAPRTIQLRWQRPVELMDAYEQPAEPGMLLACKESRSIGVTFYTPVVEIAPGTDQDYDKVPSHGSDSSSSDGSDDSVASEIRHDDRADRALSLPKTRKLHVNFDVDIFRHSGKDIRDRAVPDDKHNFKAEVLQQIQFLHIPLGHFKYYREHDERTYDEWSGLTQLRQFILVAELPYHYSYEILTKSNLMSIAQWQRSEIDAKGIQALKQFIRSNGFNDTLGEELLRKDGENSFRKRMNLSTESYICNIEPGLSPNDEIIWNEYRELDLVPISASFTDKEFVPDPERQILRPGADWIRRSDGTLAPTPSSHYQQRRMMLYDISTDESDNDE